MRSAERELIEGIEAELMRYPVSYAFGRGGKHNFVQIKTESGGAPRITFACTPRNAALALVKTRGVIRRTMRDLNIEPKDGRQRCGSLGLVMVDAARREAPPVRVDYHREEPQDEMENMEALARPATLAPMPLCPDAIREETKTQAVASVPAQPKEGKKPMLARPDAAPATNEGKTYSKMLRSEITQATRIIVTNATIDDEKRLVTWKDGWSDERLHAILSGAPGRDGLKLHTVTEWRRSEFGDTAEEKARATSRSAPVVVETTNRLLIEQLQKQVADLSARVGALEDAATRPA